MMFSSDGSHISITVIFNFATLITFFTINNPPHSPLRFTMIYPDVVVVTIMAGRVFRNIKLGRHSKVLIPTEIDLTQLDYGPGTGREHSHHRGDMNTPMESPEVSRWKDISRFPITDPHKLGIEKPSTHLGGAKVTTTISEFTRR